MTSEFKRANEDPEGFWMEQASRIDWFKPPLRALGAGPDPKRPVWFRDAELNSCWLAVDRHIAAGRGDATALIYDSPVTGQQQSFTYNELHQEVSRTAGMLQKLGLGLGDRVIIYMPMVPEAVFAMLASARLGAVHSVVFGGFAAPELASRIDDARPKVLLTASCGIEGNRVLPYLPIVQAALSQASHQVSHTVLLQRSQHPDTSSDAHDWQKLMADAEAASWVQVPAQHPLYILYTSGTTGQPKGIVRDHGGHAVALSYSMQRVYGAEAGDTFWAASDIGWVVGHSYIVYAPLMAGCTTVLYEGKPVGTPDAGAFWRLISEHRVNLLFTAPTAFRALRKEDPDARLLQQYDIGSLRALFLAGERTDPATWHWLHEKTGLPVIDHWWQTETGWPVASSPRLPGSPDLKLKPGSVSQAVPGFDVHLLGADGQPVAAGEEGDIVIRLPLPPGCLSSIWENDQLYVQNCLSKWPGYYLTGDSGFRDEDDYLYIMGRTDDVINVAGHRLSTGQMEEVIAGHAAVAEGAVVGAADPQKGQVPVALVVLQDGVMLSAAALEQELITLTREQIGAIAGLKRVLPVPRLPKTRSGKILRRVVRQMLDGESYRVPATIEDPAVLQEIEALLQQDENRKNP